MTPSMLPNPSRCAFPKFVINPQFGFAISDKAAISPE